MDHAGEQFIETVDAAGLHAFDWPLHRALVPGYVEQLELHRHARQLLQSGRWQSVQFRPHAEAGHAWHHVYDVFGVPTGRPGEEWTLHLEA